MRRTKQGEVILEELRRLQTHPRSDELYELVRARLPHVSLGTVYRNLDRLQREGLAAEIYCGAFVRYDGNVAPHDHFLCRHCGRVWDFTGGASDCSWEAGMRGDRAGFQVEGRYTMFYGTCAQCREAAAAPS